MDRIQREFGDKLDAYLLVQPDGSILADVRYGSRPEDYLTPLPSHLAGLKNLSIQHAIQWRPCRWDDELTRPKLPGHYQFRIAGDSETDGPHVYYEYPDYTTFGEVFPEEEGYIHAQGSHDEEPESIIAWYGPINVPDCDCF
ncbi:hypothetical protein ACFLEY_22150 [Bradyrhizobium sp. YCK136]|uniref:hypothetical protein n=1 Tax=Bradyrhizobium sp. YCK136 TaxID=3351346 RepID=UPI0037C67DA4